MLVTLNIVTTRIRKQRSSSLGIHAMIIHLLKPPVTCEKKRLIFPPSNVTDHLYWDHQQYQVAHSFSTCTQDTHDIENSMFHGWVHML